jgi:hypothetical protein
MVGLSLIVLIFVGWTMRIEEPRTEEDPTAKEISATREFLDKVEAEEAARTQSDKAPAVVRQFERTDARPVVRLEVSPVPARFVSKKTGRIYCTAARSCQVPVDGDIWIKKQGFRSLLLSRDDLYDRRAGTWRVVLQRW